MSFDYQDEPTHSEEASKKAVKQVFWWALWLTYLALIVVTTPLIHWLGFSNGGLVFPLMLLSNSIAIRTCRRAGVSREENRQEIIERSAGAALAPLLSEAPEFSELIVPAIRFYLRGDESALQVLGGAS